ncbi:hypothetical protein DSO57_1009632 [Entomophthora muscae]|uniref:Uncharacterized protein n=1 Tax=Entomophthora muscae TaxID=34485 RepID=A0ACC2U541_9FUNG|nr:hypothetical protein DSO57_1009632 [Entomophthora muscae]
MCEDTGGGKKMKAKGGAALAPSAMPDSMGDVPEDWEDQWNKGNITGQNGSRNPWCDDFNITKLGAA